MQQLQHYWFWICFTWSLIEAFKSKRHNTFRFTKSNSTRNPKHLIGWVYVSENPQFNESNFELDLLKTGLFNWSNNYWNLLKSWTCTVTCNLVYTYGLFGLYAFRLYTWNLNTWLDEFTFQKTCSSIIRILSSIYWKLGFSIDRTTIKSCQKAKSCSLDYAYWLLNHHARRICSWFANLKLKPNNANADAPTSLALVFFFFLLMLWYQYSIVLFNNKEDMKGRNEKY